VKPLGESRVSSQAPTPVLLGDPVRKHFRKPFGVFRSPLSQVDAEDSRLGVLSIPATLLGSSAIAEHFFDFAEGHVPTTSATRGEKRHQGLFERVENSFSRQLRNISFTGSDSSPFPRRLARAPPPFLFVDGATPGRRFARDFRGGRRSVERATAPPDVGFVCFTSAPPAPSPSRTPLSAFYSAWELKAPLSLRTYSASADYLGLGAHWAWISLSVLSRARSTRAASLICH
jgi:hypothetical protein